VPQAEALEAIVAGRDPLVVVDIAVADEELIGRLTSRRVCGRCGANAEVPAPLRQAPGSPEPGRGTPGQAAPVVCGRCGGALTERADDREDVIRERLRVYARDTRPLIEYYRGRPGFRTVNGAQAPSAVAHDLEAAVNAAVALRQAQGAASASNGGAA
jgi:adenylate kinase